MDIVAWAGISYAGVLGMVAAVVTTVVLAARRALEGAADIATAAIVGDRFERFTNGARRVLTLAQHEAQRLNHNHIGTEHLLLGLLGEEEGTAAHALRNLGVDLEKVRTPVESILGRGVHPASGEVGLTPRAKRVIELAIDEARRLDHDYIGTEHLLLGLIRERDGVAAQVLVSLGVGLKQMRAEVLRLVSTRSAED
jgi:ATP-dependent Clp protease ATP-binding subunit ClpC